MSKRDTVLVGLNGEIYQKVFEDYDSPVLIIRPKGGDILEVNNSAVEFYGYPKEVLITKKIQDISLLNISKIKEELNIHSEGKRRSFQSLHKLASNVIKEVEVHNFPVVCENEKLIFSIIYDISKNIEEKLMFDSLFLNSPYGTAILDRDQRVININQNFTNIFKYSKEEVIGKTISQLVSTDQNREHIKNKLKTVYRGEIVKQEGRRKRKDGQIISVEILAYPVVKNDEIIGVYVLYKDITQEKALKQKDYLTGLFNRKFFLDKIATLIEDYSVTSQGFALILIDFNEYKDINDSLGHDIGDKLLIEVARRLLDTKYDKNITARLRDDDFAVLCEIKDVDEIKKYAERIMFSLSKPFFIDNNAFYITPNIGISIYPKDGENVESIMRAADIALSKAKERSVNRLCFYSTEMSIEISNKILYPSMLMKAISNNELSIYYQPIFDINKDKNIMGLEALLRWKNQVLGQVPPNDFIPLAEKTGQIVSIGYWVFEEVCKQIKIWNRKAYPCKYISVNVSVKQLEQNDFSSSIVALLKNYDVDPSKIVIEITESLTTGDIEIIVNKIRELKLKGFKICIDDFGTGFSSLRQLDLFELNKLKIDKTFIDDIVNDSKRQNLVKSIISMAKSLNLTVVAEGIETTEQLNYLKKLGCDLGQGFYFSKPLPITEIESLLEAQN